MALHFSPPIHPGEFLREEYLIPLGISAGALAKRIGVPRTRIERIVTRQTGMTTDTALRLARFFRTSPEFWLNFQQAYELAVERERMAPVLSGIEEMQPA